MSKHKNVPAITEAAKRAGQITIPGLAGRRVAALMAEGDKIAASLPNGHHRTLQIVSTGKITDGGPSDGFSALIKHGNKTIQIEGDSFAVTTHD